MKQIIDYFKTIGVDANTTATIFITLFVFIAGLLATWVASQLKKASSKKSYRKVFLAILTDFDQSCRVQELMINESIHAYISQETKENLRININQINTLDYLNKIDHQVFLENFRPYFRQKKFFKVSSKLFTLLAVIREQNQGIQDYITTHTSDLKNVLNDFMEGAKGLRDILDQVIFNMRTDHDAYFNSQKWYDEYLAIFFAFAKNGGKSSSIFYHSDIVRKVIELNNTIIDSPLAVEAGKFARQCDVAQSAILQKETEIIKRFSRFVWNHRLAYRLTTVIIRILK